MKVYLLRHGETDGVGPKRFIGRTDLPLSPRGRLQARQWRNTLAAKGIERIYASDLSRCAETARIIAGCVAADVTLRPDLREIDLGMLEGRAMTEVRENLPALWARRGRDIAGFRPENGESFQDLYHRVIPVIETILRKQETGSILVVSHAGVNRVILCHVLGMPLENLFMIPQQLGCLNLLERSGERLRATLINRPCP